MPKVSQESSRLEINRKVQLLLALAGTLILIAYWRSWQDFIHLVYDIPAGFVMCAYIAQIVCEGLRGQFSASWWVRVILMIPLSIIPSGREFFGWSISGHLTNLLAVASIQSTDVRLGRWERIGYWLPLPIILYVRWFHFDVNGHGETVNAVVAGIAMFASYVAILKALMKYQ